MIHAKFLEKILKGLSGIPTKKIGKHTFYVKYFNTGGGFFRIVVLRKRFPFIDDVMSIETGMISSVNYKHENIKDFVFNEGQKQLDLIDEKFILEHL